MDINEARKRLPILASLDDQSFVDVVHKKYYADMDKAEFSKWLGVKPTEAPAPERSTMRAVGDLATQFGGGVVSGVRMMTDMFGADNRVSQGLRSAEEALQSLQSAAAQQDQQKVAAIMQEAEGKGWGEQIALGLKAAMVAPGAMMAQSLGTAVPTLATALIPGVGPAAVAARTAAGAAVGAAQGAGNIKGVIYEDVKRELAKANPGMSPQEIEARAVEAQSFAGENAGQIALGGALGVAAGTTGMERALSGLRNGVTKAPAGVMTRALAGGTAEAVPEFAQGGQEKYASNVAQAGQGLNVDPWSGVVAQGTMEAAAGFAPGAISGIPAPKVTTPGKEVGDTIRAQNLVPESGPLGRAVNAGTEARAQQAEAEIDATVQNTRLTGTSMADMMAGQADPLQGAMRQADPAVNESLTAAAPTADQLPDATKMVPPGVDPETGEVVQPAPQAEPLDFTGKTDEELKQARKNAQDPTLRKAIAKELQTRRAAVSPAAPEVQAEAEAAKEKPTTLPSNLAGAKERYNFGKKGFDLAFDDDIDRAAYITALTRADGKRSAKDADYLKFVMDATGMTEAEVRAHGQKVRDSINGLAKGAEPGALKVPKVEYAKAAQAVPAGNAGSAAKPRNDAEIIANAVAYADGLGLTDKNERKDAILGDLSNAWGMTKDEVENDPAVKAALKQKPSLAAKEKNAGRVVDQVKKQALDASKKMQDEIDAEDAPVTQPATSGVPEVGAGGSQPPQAAPAPTEAESQWTRATTADRIAIARAGGILLKAAENVARKGWADQPSVVQEKLTRGIAKQVATPAPQTTGDDKIDAKLAAESAARTGKAEKVTAKLDELLEKGSTAKTPEDVLAAIDEMSAVDIFDLDDDSKAQAGAKRVDAEEKLYALHDKLKAENSAADPANVEAADTTAKRVDETPENEQGAQSAPAGQEETSGKPKKKSQTAKQKREALENHFRPGNVIQSDYWKEFDRVVEFDWNDGNWSVTVEKVLKEGEGWKATAGKRKHSTTPDARDKVVFEAPAPAEPVAPSLDAKPASKTPAKIEDSGEVLEGARKLYAKSYAAKLDEGKGMDLAVVPLSKSWPEPDYQRLIDEGADPWAVALARAVRDEIPNKPMKGWKLKGWVQKVEGLRDMAAKAMSGEITKDKFTTEAGKFKLDNWLNKIDLYEAVGHANSLKTLRFSEGEYGMYGGQVFKPAKKLWTINMPSTSASATWSNGNWGNDLVAADTKAEAIEKFKAWAAEQDGKEQDKPASKRTEFDVYRYRNNPKAFIVGKRISSLKSIDLKEFASEKEARQFIADNQAELEKMLADAKTEQPERREENAPRVGDDHRNGADVTTEQFRETFGFRGEQFGASMPQSERQANMNQAYDALMDLAGVIGIPPKALSLNGELGLAFGARGRGGKNPAMAHYEPDTTGAVTPNRVVINLTRKNGAGSLAHEWFHAVDNYFARMRGEKAGMLTESYPAKREGVRPEMVDAFKRVMMAIQSTGVRERSKNMDKKRTKDYWSTGLEMAARAFESYIIAKLQDKSGSNDYLANILPESLWLQQESYPYPTMGELPAIRTAFDNFFATVQTKETDKGVAMFSRRTASGNALPDSIIGHRLGALNEHKDNAAAKAGDEVAALRLAKELVDAQMVKAVKDAAGDAPIFVPVVSVEATGKNKIPLAVSEVFASKLGASTTTEIVQVDSPKRTAMDGLDRLLTPPEFDGEVIPGASYVLVDDTITQGGTFAALASHILDNGGKISAVVALTGKQYSAKIQPSTELLNQVREQYGDIESDFRAATGYGFDALTQSEARYLAKHNNAESVRNRIIEAGRKTGQQPNEGNAGFARNPLTQFRGIEVEAAQGVVDGIASRWTNAPEIVVVADLQDAKVPERVRLYDAEQRSQGASGEAEGFWYGGKAYIVAAAINTPQDVARVLFHETLGHYGLRGTFGEGLTPILKQLAAMRRPLVAAKAEQYGLDMGKESDRLQAAEEVLAEMAQSKPEMGYVKRAIAAIRAFLRKNVPGFQKMALTDADIIANFIIPARAFVERGRKGQGQSAEQFSRTEAARSLALSDTAMSRGTDQTHAFKRWFGDSKVVDADGKPLVVYHGTPNDFAEFDKNLAREDGFYFTADPEHAEQYAGANGVTMPIYLALQNPMRVHGSQLPSRASKKTMNRMIEDAKAAGHDGVIIEAFKDHIWGKSNTFIAFRPEQIKSATGNNGDFDPANPDIRFSRAVGATELAGQVRDKLFDVSGATGNTLAHYRGMALQTLGRRQLVDLYGDMLPQLKKYDELVQRMDAEKNDSAAEADAIANEWGKLDEKPLIGPAKNPGMERKLAELMHDATLAQMDPDKPLQDGDNPVQHAELKAKFDALTPQAQSVYRRARNMYEGHYAKVREAIQERIMRSELGASEKKAMIARMDADFFQKTKGVYFPLARFGKYVMVVKDADGKVVNVSRAETLNEAETTRKMLLREFDKAKGFNVTKVMKEAEFNRNQDMVGKGFVTDLFAVLDKQGVDAELRDSVSQLYLSSLPDLSWAKHGIHRKGTPGFSQDARRAFAQNVFHGARYLAKLRYSDQMQNEITAMGDHIKVYESVDEYDGVKAQQVLDEMAKRHDNLMSPDTNSLSTALTSVGYMWFMGLSPAAAMVNLSQTALVAYPVMGAKWGYDKAASALLLASKQTVQAKNDISKILKGDELDAYNRAVADGTIDVTMAHDLAGISQGEDAKVTWALRPVMKVASFMFHHAERFNRQATFIASYRLAKESGAGLEAAFEQAKKATYDGHFDYSSSNRPRIMQGNVARVVFLFKQYGQNMVYTLSRQAYLATQSLNPKERAEARKQLGGMLALHAAAAGGLGLPLVGALLSAASFIGGDDDEPWDAEVALKNAMADAMGPKAAEVMAHGLSRLTPWDISGRVALNKLILPDVQEGLEGQRWAESMSSAMLGPVWGIVSGMAKGVQEMGEGRYQRGLENMLPVALRNPVKALRYQGEGAIDKTGIAIKDEVSMAGVLGQASGFSPSEVRAATEVKSAIYQHDRARMDRRSSLMSQFAQAQMAGDTEGMAEVRQMIAKFNEKNPQRRILPRSLYQSVHNREKRINEAEQGVYLPKNRRDSLDAVRFGE